MPLQTQKLAGHEQKRTAFLSFISSNKNTECFGYTTKPGAPIYLLGETAIPFNRAASFMNSNDDTWSSFLLLPDILVPLDDNGIRDVTATKPVPQFEAPLDADFFVSCLGSNLLRGTQSIPTVDALRNTRLVGLYWSAHWCGRKLWMCCFTLEIYLLTFNLRLRFHSLPLLYSCTFRNVRDSERCIPRSRD